MPGKKIKNSPPTRKTRSRRKPKAGKAPALGPRLDAGARSWLRLLNDPCSAPLARPCYEGTGTGYISRQRTLVAPPATATDFLLEFTPSHGAQIAYRSSWSATPGGGLGNAAQNSLGGMAVNTAIIGRERCVAACVRVVYIGSEATRQGLVSMFLSQGAALVDQEPIAGNAYDWGGSAGYTRRMGEVIHECKWAPGPGDERFRTFASVPEDVGTNENAGTSVVVAIAGAAPASFYLEIMYVYEWQPAREVAGSRQISDVVAPASRNNMNEIVSALGDLGKWAVGQAVTYGARAAGMIANQAIPGMSYAAQGLLAFSS